jgi:spore maturation protein CgeB
MSFEDVFKDKALFHNPHDSDSLAQNILYYINHPDTREKHVIVCQNMITQNYSKETIEPLMKDLFTL